MSDLTAPAPIGDLVRAWRVSLGLSQSQAAEALHVTTRTLQGWEAGRPARWPGLIALALEAAGSRVRTATPRRAA